MEFQTVSVFDIFAPLKHDTFITSMQSFEVIIKTVIGKEVNILVYPYTTVKQLKISIEKVDDIKVHNQRIIFSGKQLDDDYTLKHYNIKSGDLIHLVLQLRGGMFHETSSRKDNKDLLGAYIKERCEICQLIAPEDDLIKQIILLEQKISNMK